MKHIFITAITFLTFQTFGQTPVTTAPFELYGDHIFFKLSVDDSEPLDFILDTGDGLTVIDVDVADRLKLPMMQEQTATSAQGRISGTLIKHNHIKLNGLMLEANISVYVTKLEHFEISIGRNVDGIIGYDFLHHHVARLNYDNMQIELYDAVNYPKKGEEVPFKLHNYIPTISAYCTLNSGEVLGGTFYVNTGAGTTMDFNTPYADANGIVDKTGDHYWYLVKGLEQAETRHYEGRVGSFRFGTFSFPEFPVGISQVQGGIQGDKKVSGIIGNRLLSRFNILFDYKNHKMYLEENKNYQKPFVVNCSGLDIQMSQDMQQILVHQVIENSPASAAGIAENDVIVKVNETKAGELTLAQVDAALKKPGSKVILVLRRDGKEREVSLELKELL